MPQEPELPDAVQKAIEGLPWQFHSKPIRFSMDHAVVPDADYDKHMEITKPTGWTHEAATPPIEEMLAHHMQQILDHLGISRTDAHTEKTPERYAKMMLELFGHEPFEFTTFPSTSDEMVVLGPIPFYTLCAHHIIPFFGDVWIGYIPDKAVGGLSKFPRLIKNLTKGMHVQEELTGFIADQLIRNLQPLGVGVVMKAEHLCMAMRGVKQPGVATTTSAMRGVFADHTRTAKAEFVEWVQS